MYAHANSMSSIHNLFDFIGVLARHRHQRAETEFTALGLTHTEARLLHLLQGEGGIAPQDVIAQQITIDRSNVGRALQNLEHRGYLQRRPHFADKRAKVVALSEQGKAAVAEIQRLREKMASTFFGDLTEGEADQVLEILKRAVGTNG